MDKYLIFYLTCITISIVQGKYSEENAELLVAFKCGHPNLFFHNGVWKKDRNAECLRKPIDILAYCKHVYPAVNIQNVMEIMEPHISPSWCSKGDPDCKQTIVGAVSYKCLTESFKNEALLVPEPCIFDHLHDSSQCSTTRKWSEMAGSSCRERGFSMHRHSVLKPCGLNMFSGVEFVCCPTSFNDSPRSSPASIESKTGKKSDKSGEEKSVKSDAPAAAVIVAKHEEKKKENSGVKIVDAYLNGGSFGNEKGWNEHDFYLKAKKDLARHHKFKVTEMMNDWNSARLRAMQLKQINKKEGEKLRKQITERFQKLYEAEEVENEMEKKQLSDLHQQRVTADLNERKQLLLDHYLDVLDSPAPEITDIIRALRHLIKILHKDRLHTVNRFKHLQETDPDKAESIRQSSANHITGLDKQLNEALSLLDRVPKFKEKVNQHIAEYTDSYHSVDASFLVILEKQNEVYSQKSQQKEKLVKPADDDYVVDVSDDDDDDDDDYVKNSEGRKSENDVKAFSNLNKNAPKKDEGFKKTDAATVEKLNYGDGVNSFPEVTADKMGRKQFKGQKETKSAGGHSLPSMDVNESGNTREGGAPVIVGIEIENEKKEELNKSSFVEKADNSKQKIVGSEQSENSSDEDEERSDDMREMDDGGLDSDIFERHFFPDPDHMQKNDFNIEQLPKYGKHAPTSIPGPNFGAAIPLGVAVGTLTVAIVIVIGVLVMRRRGGNGAMYSQGPTGGGDPAELRSPDGLHNASPEERHVANMQMNGYENPTYKYFERYQQKPAEA